MTIRDADRFKDKLEVSLDGRQVFFLFFGGAVVACLVFVLGVMVGKRLESRERVARKAVTSTAVDPLAALDELGADEHAASDDLAFPTALAPGDAKAKARALDAADLAPARSFAPEGTGAAMQAARAVATEIAEAQAAAASAPLAKIETEAKAEKLEKPDEKPAAKPAAPAAPAAGGDDRKFTLQISSFQERAEADALVSKLVNMGYKPYIVMSDVPEKGIFFRVRIGEYPSRDAALAGKEEFEKKERIIAYVTRI